MTEPIQGVASEGPLQVAQDSHSNISPNAYAAIQQSRAHSGVLWFKHQVKLELRIGDGWEHGKWAVTDFGIGAGMRCHGCHSQD